MINVTPNDSFDDITRHVDVKVQVYFDTDPTTFYSSDFLVDISLIEESSGETKNPLGAVSANEFEFSLANRDDVFTPSNPDSPYFGKINVGLIIEPFICSTMSNLNITAETDNDIVWISLGKYTVTSWTAKAGSLLANVSATDVMQSILSTPMPRLKTIVGNDFGGILKYLFKMLDVQEYVIIDGLSRLVINYVPFADSDTVPLILQKISEAAICAIYANRDGIPTVRPFIYSTPTFELTDDNQIISIDTQQSILKSYNGVDVSFYRYQESELHDLLNIRDLSVPVGSFTHGPYVFDKPLYRISSIISESNGQYFAPIDTYDACSSDILFNTSNGINIVIESGMYSTSNGSEQSSSEYNRSSTKVKALGNTTYRIYTPHIGGGESLTICTYSNNGAFVQSFTAAIADNGICNVMIPPMEFAYTIKTEAGALSYIDGSENDEPTNMSRFPNYKHVVAGYVYKVQMPNNSMAGEAFNAFFYDAERIFVSHQLITIDSRGIGIIEVPSGASYLRCHFNTAIVPIGANITFGGDIDQTNFSFYGRTNVLKIGDTITIATDNDAGKVTNVTVQGTCLEYTQLHIKDNVSNVLSVDNNLIQSAYQASLYKSTLTKFVHATIPELTLTIRGNPLMEIGDVISVHSAKYKIDFVGILKRAEYKFNGSLSCNITLLNAEVVS